MGSLIAYSGIATKVKAMERWRIKDEQFLEMAALETYRMQCSICALPALPRDIRTGGGQGSAQGKHRAASESVPVQGFCKALPVCQYKDRDVSLTCDFTAL